jgi:hypothetical protein
VPALWSFLQVRSLRRTLEPLVEFDCHRGKKMALVHSIQQVFPECTASDVSGRPDPDCHHASAHGVDDLRRNAFGFFRARLGFFKPGVKLSQGLFRRSLRPLAAASRHRVSSRILSLLRGCHGFNLAEGRVAWKDYRHSQARAVPSAPAGLRTTFRVGASSPKITKEKA